jgi:hypothetical protein
MARTQWSRVHWPDVRTLDHFGPAAEAGGSKVGKRTQSIAHLPQRIVIENATDQRLRLSQPLALAKGDADADLELLEHAKGDFTGRASGADVSVRGWEALSHEERSEFALWAATALSRHLGIAEPPRPQPYFDREARVWAVKLRRSGDEKPLRVIFTGEFPTQLREQTGKAIDISPFPGAIGERRGAARPEVDVVWRRVPADVFALVRLWSGEEQSYAVDTTVRALYSPWELDASRLRGIGVYGSTNLHVVLAEIVDVLADNQDILHLYVEVSDRHFANLSSTERLLRARKVAELVKGLLPEQPGDSVILGALEDVPNSPEPHRIRSSLHIPGRPDVVLEVVPLAEFPDDAPDSMDVLIGFRIRERWLPGEHGYRFFPAFYRHLYDTMRRTPLLEPTDKTPFAQEQERAVSIPSPEKSRYVETFRTAYDNIHPTTSHVLAFSRPQRLAVISRAKPKSLEEIRQYFRILFGTADEGGFGAEPRESTRFAFKVFQYLTSGPTRRRQLETSSWWDFVEGDTYSPAVRRLIEKWPEALVAMDAKNADARTHGNALVQLTLDNLAPEGYRDGTLRGPTSEAWLVHWRRYLEAQGVEFIHGELKGFQVLPADDEGRSARPWPIVGCYEPRYARIEGESPPLMPGYFVLATSAPVAARLAKEFRDVASKCGDLLRDSESNMEQAANLSLGNVDEAVPQGDLRHFAGIQFYFAEDVLGVDGHVYYTDSPWGLTSISQARFWEDRTDWEHGYRGVLSAIIGTWDAPGQFTKKKAWHCSPDELAHEVWQQIKASVSSRGSATRRTRVGTTVALNSLDDIPDPIYFHLDDGLTWLPEERRYKNEMPFHIASPTGWRGRPGDPQRGYRVEHGWVVCGMFTKTFTRAPCMESANESARHAVNAILEHHDPGPGAQRLRTTRCQLFDPEEYEVNDLRWFKDLDEKLAERGLPHFMEILEVDRRIDSVLRGGPDDPLDPLNLIRQLSRANIGLRNFLSPFYRSGC